MPPVATFFGTWHAPPGDRGWLATVGQTMAGKLDAGTVYKTAGDSVTLVMDFGDFPQCLAGESLFVLSVAGNPTDLVVGTGSLLWLEIGGAWFPFTSITVIGNYAVPVTVSGGTAGTPYTVTFTVQWSDGSVNVRSGTLMVE